MPTINSGDTTLFFERINEQANKPYLVFLHEGLGCVDLWGGFPQQLCEATGYPGVVFDRVGHGKSSASQQAYTQNYLHKCALYELPLLLSKVVGDRPYILIGHSDGGSIALIAASENAPNIKGVVTLAAHTMVEKETVEGVNNALEAYRVGKLQKLFDLHGQHTETLFFNWANRWLSPDFISWNIEYLLSAIKVPVLAIQGGADVYGTEKQVEPIEQANPTLNTVKVIPRCGHNPHTECNVLVMDLIGGFLERI
ncbi:hypothetical protein A9Q99_13225 [Gammaproteobacteria bacterium 45_16_T64]|nr:hypothetical protein A9Q99_13225 [Gammaproteobacteria bacterium 45_16_T64]